MHARAYAYMHGLNNNFFNDGDEPSRGTRFARRTVTGTMARARKFHHEQRPDVETPARFPSIENQTVELAKRRVTDERDNQIEIFRAIMFNCSMTHARDFHVFDDRGCLRSNSKY